MNKIENAFLEFAKKTNKSDNHELLMYFKAGWSAAMEQAIKLLEEQK